MPGNYGKNRTQAVSKQTPTNPRAHARTHTHKLWNRHCINTIHKCNTFRPLEAIFREYNWYILAARGSSCHVSQYTIHAKLNCTAGDSFCWPTLLDCINYTPWRLPFKKGWNMSELRIVFIKWWFNIMWVHLLVFDTVTLAHGYEQDFLSMPDFLL